MSIDLRFSLPGGRHVTATLEAMPLPGHLVHLPQYNPSNGGLLIRIKGGTDSGLHEFNPRGRTAAPITLRAEIVEGPPPAELTRGRD